MAGYLENYIMSVGVGQVRAVLRIAEQLRTEGIIQSDEEFRTVLDGLQDQITNKINFTPSFDSTRIRAEDLNQNFREIFIDLFGLYNHVDELDKTFRTHLTSTDGLRQTVRKAIHRLQQDVRQFLFLRSNPEYNELKFVDFSDTRNLTTSRTKALVDGNSRTLRLPWVRRDRHNEARGAEGTTMTTEILTDGAENAISKTFETKNALDQNNSSFWAEVLLTDDIVQTTYQDDQGADTTVDGVVVKATVSFDKPQFINNVQILPFGSYPVKILDIRFDGVSWEGYSDQPADFDWFDFTGVRGVVESMEIYFQQEHYNYVNYLVPDWAWHNNQLWDQLIDRQLEDRYVAEAEGGLEVRDSLSSPGLGALIRAREEFTELMRERESSQEEPAQRVKRIVDTILQVLDARAQPLVSAVATTDTNDTTERPGYVELDKLEYVLGAFSIVTSDIEYAPFAVYDSPKFAVRHNLTDIELVTEDRVILGVDESTLLGSIEYDLVLGEDTSFPALPTGQTGIAQEFLVVDPVNRRGETRFVPDAVTGLGLFANGVQVGTITPPTQTVVIPEADYDPDKIFTVDYTPVSSQSTIDVDDLLDSREQIDFFENTDNNGGIQLRYLPHVVYDIVNDLDRWNREDPRDGVWTIDPAGAAVNYDGISYGFATGTLGGTGISDSALTLDVSAGIGTGFPTEGVLAIEDERISYADRVVDTFSDLVRGIDGTETAAHAAAVTVTLVSVDRYRPLRLFVDGQEARNITDYRTREHPAFTNVPNSEGSYEFVQVGRRVYLNKAIDNATIEVQYRYIAEFVAMRVTLRSHQLGTISRTPVVDRFQVQIKSEQR